MQRLVLVIMLYNRAIDRLLIIAVPAALFVYASTRPVIRLSPDMPPGFAEVPPHASPQQRAAEEHIAQAYWNQAVTLIQWRYSYGSPLPVEPPDDFQIGAQSAGTAKTARDSQLRYWLRLRRFWDVPSTWTTSHEWNTHWLTDPISNGVEGIQEYVRDLIRRG